MREYITDAIVLNREPIREFDELFTLFSRELGIIDARAISSRKSHSKFSSQLDALSLARVRVVGEGGFTIADAALSSRFPRMRENPKILARALRVFAFLRETFPRDGIDAPVWDFFVTNFSAGEISIDAFLSLLGYDAQHAVCGGCKKSPVVAFLFDDHSFRCAGCVSKIPQSRLLYRDEYVS